MCKFFCWIAGLLSSIGAINWGLVAFFQFNLVEYLYNLLGVANLDKIIYGVVAVAGIYLFLSLFTCRGSCKTKEQQ